MVLCREMVVSANGLDIQRMQQVYHAMELPRPKDFEADGVDTVTLDTFASTMRRLDEEMQQMQAFRDQEDVAVMRLDVTAMKGNMLPVPKERLQAIKVPPHLRLFWIRLEVLLVFTCARTAPSTLYSPCQASVLCVCVCVVVPEGGVPERFCNLFIYCAGHAAEARIRCVH